MTQETYLTILCCPVFIPTIILSSLFVFCVLFILFPSIRLSLCVLMYVSNLLVGCRKWPHKQKKRKEKCASADDDDDVVSMLVHCRIVRGDAEENVFHFERKACSFIRPPIKTLSTTGEFRRGHQNLSASESSSVRRSRKLIPTVTSSLSPRFPDCIPHFRWTIVMICSKVKHCQEQILMLGGLLLNYNC